MLMRKEYIEEITFRLSWLLNKIEFSNSLSLYDDDIHAETFFCGLLNAIWGYQLKNLNSDTTNHVAIDLGDKSNRVAIQVTVQREREKIQSTIDKFLENGLQKDYDRLIILIMGEKPNFRVDFNTGGKFSFSTRDDIWGKKNLIKALRAKTVNELSDIKEYLDKELSPIKGFVGAGSLHIAKIMRKKAYEECLKKLLAAGIKKEIADNIISNDIQSRKYEYILKEVNAKKCYLIGEFGMGKSHALTILVQRYAQHFSTNCMGLLPLFALAKEIASSGSIRLWVNQFSIPMESCLLFIDGLDEIDYSTARELSDEIRLLLSQEIRILVGSRILYALVDESQKIRIAPLTNQERISLYQTITGDTSANMVFAHIKEEMGEMLSRPFYCIIFAQLKASPMSWAKKDIDIVSEFIEKSLQKCGDEAEITYDDLANMAAKSIDRGLGDILLSEVQLKSSKSSILKTGFISLSNNYVSFPLPIITQWLAAESIRRKIVKLDDILSSELRANRWMYALSILFCQMTFEESLEYFSAIVKKKPGIASRIIRDGIRFGQHINLPSADECGKMIQQCMQIWIESLGKLSNFIAPCCNGKVRPLAIKIENDLLCYGWTKNTDGSIAAQMPHEKIVQSCGSMRSRSIHPQPTWPWILTFEELSDRLAKAIKNHTLFSTNGQLADEWFWSLALHMRGGSKSIHEEQGIELSYFERYRKHVGQGFILNGKNIPTSEFFNEVDRLLAQGVAKIDAPYPLPDKKQNQSGWIWGDYSASKYLEKAQFVCRKALEEYMNLVNSVFYTFRDSLWLARLYPCKLVGGLKFTEGMGTGDWAKDTPQMTWYWEALPYTETGYIDIQLKEIPFDDHRLYETIQKRNEELRPLAEGQIGARMASGEFTQIISTTPVSDITFDWLKEDLKEIGWIS